MRPPNAGAGSGVTDGGARGTPVTVCLILLAALTVSPLGCAAETEVLLPSDPNRENVVLLHAIARSNRQMDALAKHLHAAGYKVLNVDYPTRELSIAELADHVNEKIAGDILRGTRVHYVGCSLGALVARALVKQHRPLNLGRVVQLAPPNQGSEVADALQNFWPYKKFYGPAGQQLVTRPSVRAELFGETNYELGVIAGTRSLFPLSSWLLPGADDGRVSVTRTRVKGMKDHITLPVTHTGIAGNAEVHAQVLNFLQHGIFRARSE